MKSLRMDKEEYHALVQQIPDIIYKLDKDGYFTFLNDSVSMLGYKPDELLGKHYSMIVHKDYIDKVSREKVLPIFLNKITGDQNAPSLPTDRCSKTPFTALPFIIKSIFNVTSVPGATTPTKPATPPKSRMSVDCRKTAGLPIHSKL